MKFVFQLAIVLFLTKLTGNMEARDLFLENLALRQQIHVLTKDEKKSRGRRWDRVFWSWLCGVWRRWRALCCIFKPATILKWHRAGFRLYWKWKSRKKAGRSTIEKALIDLIRKMAHENPTWGAPRIHGELLKLGYEVSEATVSKYMPKRLTPAPDRQGWKSFLENQVKGICAMDFMVVHTWNYSQLYVLLILDHTRRVVKFFNVTEHPTHAWVRQQLKYAFAWEENPPSILKYDRDCIFQSVTRLIRSMGIQPDISAYRSPWQNGACERMIGSIRWDLLDHVIILNEEHLRKLLKEYFHYYHQDRTHLSLGKDCPRERASEKPPGKSVTVQSKTRLGGLHHRYTWKQAA